MEMKNEWKYFLPGNWCEKIDVRDFIQKNYTPYIGNEDFLSGTTARTERVKAAFEEKLKEVLANHGIEVIILAGFMTILTENFTSAYPKRILNVHPSLIPSFCGKGMYGLRVHEAALGYGVKVTGATVHFVNEVPDGGEIIYQKAVDIEPDDTPETLQRRVMEQAEWILLPRAIEKVAKEMLA